MPAGIEGDSSSETQTQNAVGVTRADDYTPGENETAEETAKNVLALLEAEQDGDGSENEPAAEEGADAPEVEEPEAAAEEGEQPQETEAQAAARARDENGRFIKSQQQPEQAAQQPIQIPSVLTDPKNRKAYMNLPQGLRREFDTMLKNQQAHFTRKTQEASGTINQAKAIVDGGNHYIHTNNLVDAQGAKYTPERLFNELLIAHNNIQSNPAFYIAKMIQDTQADPEHVSAYLRGENPAGVNISADPTIRALQMQVQSLTETLGQHSQASTEARIAPAAQEFAAVMQAVDQNGEFLYPELHNDDFRESTKPIVAALLRTNPGMSRGDAMKKAWSTLTGKADSQSTNPTILPARQNNLERARSAAVSVRGAIAPTGSTQVLNVDQMEASDIPDSIEETVRMAMRQLSAA